MKLRLSKFLARSNVASRRAAEKLIFSKKVFVNGTLAQKPEQMVDPQKDKVLCNGMEITIEKEKFYFLFNKPKGFLCSSVRKNKEKLVLDFFSHISARLYTVGRLDRDVTGLIFITNDGTFANQVIHPSKNVEKEYLIKVNQYITDTHLKRLAEGIVIDRRKIKPSKVTKIRKGTCKISVMDGKKHEIKLLVSSAKLDLIELKRIRIGNIRLGNLPIGSYRKMKKQEVEMFL